MIGMSLQYGSLLKTKDEQLKPEIILPKLWDHGVRSIELRAISPTDCPKEALRVANTVWDYGFQITVHSKPKSVESAVDDVFIPLSHILSHMRQPNISLLSPSCNEKHRKLCYNIFDAGVK